jgi:hypothetical protein
MGDDDKQYVKELLRKAPKTYERRKSYVNSVGDIYSIDLADMSMYSHQNKGIHFLCCIIDIYSRYAWVFPMKDKTGKTLTDTFEQLKEYPHNLWADRGTEFLNKDFSKFCEKHKINLYHTYGNSKAAYIERFIRTLKNKIHAYQLLHASYRYIDGLKDIVDEYNNSIHSSINMKPSDVFHDHLEVEENNVYYGTRKKPKFKVGDYVRISKTKGIFEKGYTPNWSKEVYRIKRVDKDIEPIMYELEDQLDEPIEGKFYEAELLKTNLHDYSRIEKVLKKKTVDGIKKVYVKYDGYDNRFNQWIDADKVKNLKHK